MKRHPGLLFGLAVALAPLAELAAPLPTDGPGGPWCVLAYEAELKGYLLPNGQPARITKQDIAQAVANFATYPKAPIVIEHADTRKEVAKIHPEWAKPQGYVVALRMGTMERTPPGASAPLTVTTLEARLDAPPATQLAINGDKAAGIPPTYPFGSVTLAHAVDEETGQDLGTVLYSFSLTAHPRLTDVPCLAAGTYYGDLDSRDDVLAMLRCVFELPALAPEADILAALDRLAALDATTAEAQGIDVGRILEDLRSAMRLPVLAPAVDVLAAVRAALTIAPTTDLARGIPAAPKPPEKPPMKFIALMATFGLPAVATEEDAEKTFVALARDGADVRKALGLEASAPLAPKLADAITASAEVPTLRARVTAYELAEKTALTKAQEEHVDAVILARALPSDVVRGAMLLEASSDWVKFQAKHPKPSPTELAQRAQDGARTEKVVKDTTEVGKGGQGEPTLQVKIAALRGVYAKAGYDLSQVEALDLVQRGETPATAAAQLGVTA